MARKRHLTHNLSNDPDANEELEKLRLSLYTRKGVAPPVFFVPPPRTERPTVPYRPDSEQSALARAGLAVRSVGWANE